MLIIRLAGLVFAFIQITLALRLLLPFVEVPLSLEEYVPTLMSLTDTWMTPFVALVEQLDLFDVSEGLAGTTGVVGTPEEFEPVVVVAMIGWALVASFVLFVLRLIFRPVG